MNKAPTQNLPPSERGSDAALKVAPGLGRAVLAPRNRHSNRNGVTLVAVLVCLGLISVLLLGAFHRSLKQRRQLDRELQMEQTRWLARAAIAHGETIARSKNDLEDAPILLKPQLSADLQSSIRIEFEVSEKQNTLVAQAWIGDEDRPEQATHVELRHLIETLPTDSSRD